MMGMFIEVNKVSREKVRSSDGSKVENPLERQRKPVASEKWIVQVEGIRIDEIRSYRKWDKNMSQEAYIEGEMTIIYTKSKDQSKAPPQILIEESFESFSSRLKTVKLEMVHG